jgi:hypothetical protein
LVYNLFNKLYILPLVIYLFILDIIQDLPGGIFLYFTKVGAQHCPLLIKLLGFCYFFTVSLSFLNTREKITVEISAVITDM